MSKAKYFEAWDNCHISQSDCAFEILWRDAVLYSLVSCPTHVHLPARNGLVSKLTFLGLLLKTGNDQWDREIGDYYVALSFRTVKFVHLHSSIRTFFERIDHKMFLTLLGYIVAKVCTSPRNWTWFTRPFLLMRRWGLGMRLYIHQTPISSLEGWRGLRV